MCICVCLLGGWRLRPPSGPVNPVGDLTGGGGDRRRRLWRRGGGGGSEVISNFPRPHPSFRPPRPGPALSGCGGGAPGWGRGERLAGVTRGLGTAPSPPTLAARSGLRNFGAAAAPQPRGHCPRGRSERPPTDATGPLAGRRAGGRRARPAARGLSGPSKRSSAIGAGDSRAEHPARPPAGLPPGCPDPRLDRGAAPEPGSRQVSARWPRGGSSVRGSGDWWGRGQQRGPGTARRDPLPGTSEGGGSRPGGDPAL